MNGRSRSRKLIVLIQPKYNSKYRFRSNTLRYQGTKLWNEVNNRFKTAANYMYDAWYKECFCSFCDICVLKAPILYW